MASLAAVGVLMGIGSFILTATMAVQAQSRGVKADLSSAKQSMDRAKRSLNEAKKLLMANISILSKEEYNKNSIQSQMLSGELFSLRKQLRAYNPNLFNSSKLKALADSVEDMKSVCDDFHGEVLEISTLARARAHDELEAQKIEQQGLTDEIQARYLDAITSLQNIVGSDTKTRTEFDLRAGLDVEKLCRAGDDDKSWMDWPDD